MEADERRAFKLVSGLMTGAHVAAMVALGVRLGLYAALDGAGAVTSEEFATTTGLHERWLREWLASQAAAGVVSFEPPDQFELGAEFGPLLATPDDLRYLGDNFGALPQRMAFVPQLAGAFQTGVGMTFDDRGEEAAADTEALLRNWYQQCLVPDALPCLEGVVEALEAGVEVADVGCGSGVALAELAAHYPASRFHGYDVSAVALARAAARRDAAGLDNIWLHQAPEDGLPTDGCFRLVITFDCLHDMTRPAEVVAGIRRACTEDASWLIADIDGGPTLEDNLARPQFASMLYSVSVLSCLPSSLSEPGGAGLGTCGLPEPAMRALVNDAGFGQFRRLDIDHPINAFYEARP